LIGGDVEGNVVLYLLRGDEALRNEVIKSSWDLVHERSSKARPRIPSNFQFVGSTKTRHICSNLANSWFITTKPPIIIRIKRLIQRLVQSHTL